MNRGVLTLVRRLATEASPAASGKLRLNFAAPHEVYFKNVNVNQVNLPSTGGDMGILSNHVPIIAQLRPGVIEVINEGKVSKYFVSGGFAIVNQDSSLNINAVEAATLDQLDVEGARGLLAEVQRSLDKGTEQEKVAAAIKAEVYQAVISAR